MSVAGIQRFISALTLDRGSVQQVSEVVLDLVGGVHLERGFVGGSQDGCEGLLSLQLAAHAVEALAFFVEDQGLS